MTKAEKNVATPEEVEVAAELLSKVQPGYLPFPIFKEISRLVVRSSIELVPFRTRNGKTEVFLTQRPQDDHYWPNEWHNPGVVIISTDKKGSFDDPIARVLNKELGLLEREHPAVQYVGPIFHQTKRGSENSHIYWTELGKEPVSGRFFDTDNLPKDTIKSHVKVIQAALDSYKKFVKT